MGQNASNVFAPPGTPIIDNPHAVQQPEDAVIEELGDSEDSGMESGAGSGESSYVDEDIMADDGLHVAEDDEADHTSQQAQDQLPEQPTANDDDDGWHNVFQFRRFNLMRHCFTRWSSYRQLISGVAHTWEVSHDDVYAVYEMSTQPKGIESYSKAIIVHLWNDMLPHESGVFSLVDIEHHQPVLNAESFIRDRQVMILPDLVSRSSLLRIMRLEGLCASRQDRCLVSHNDQPMPLQGQYVREVANGDYFIIHVPPLEECLDSFPISLVQISLKLLTNNRHNDMLGRDLELRALGNAEEATRDSYSWNRPYSSPYFHRIAGFSFVSSRSEWISIAVYGYDAAFLDCAEEAPQLFCGTVVELPFRDPCEGLPDPGNPDDQFFFIGDDENVPIQSTEDQRSVISRLHIPWDWQHVLRLFQKWPEDISLDIPPQPSPLALDFLSHCRIGVGHAQQIWMYSDGSYDKSKGISTFSVAIFGFDPSCKSPHSFEGWFGGRVVLDEGHPSYTGALTHSATEAEISGMIWAHAWLLQSGLMADVTFCFDSLIAGYGASGEWNCSEALPQLHRLRQLSQLYRQARWPTVASYEHVKAHGGQPANELVDALAKYLHQEEVPPEAHLPGVDWRPLFLGDCHVLPWAWWIVDRIAGRLSGPPCGQSGFEWQLWHSQCPSYTNISPIELQEEQQSTNLCIRLQIATFNVLSLFRKTNDEDPVETGRAALLRSQLEASGYHAVGLQETRNNSNAVYCADDYIRIVSGDTTGKGHYGCELWLAKRLPFGSNGRQDVKVDISCVTVLHCSPRLLATRVQLPGTSLLFLVGHAPHEAAELAAQEEWWNSASEVLAKFGHLGRLFFLGDFNARVGRQDDIVVGDRIDVVTSPNGERLHDLCSDFALWLPSTFSTLHRGCDYTWRHPKGPRSRLDYVALDTSLTGCVVWSSRDPDIQVPNAAIDHVLVGAYVCWEEQSRCNTTKKRIDYDWQSMRTPQGRERLSTIIRNLPEVHWNIDVHTHWQILEDSIHQGLRAEFPPQRKSTRADIFSEQTWSSLACRKRYKSLLEDWDSHFATFLMHVALLSWHDGQIFSVGMRRFALERFCFLLVRWSLLTSFRQASSTTRQSVEQDKVTYINAIGEEAAHQSNAEIFATLRRLRVGGCFRKKALTPLPLLKDSQGKILASWEDRDDRWKEHCATMEAGVETSTHELLEQLHSRSFERNCHQPYHSLEQVPTLSTLEGAFRRIRPRKAAGADQLRSDLCGLVPQELSLKYHALLTKMVLTYSEPVQMRGGVLIAAYKNGQSDSVDSYRSLLLSSRIGKAIRRTIRQQLVTLYDDTAPPLHVSVRAGGNVMHASHSLRAFLGAAHSLKRSTAVLYLDIKSAYYRTVRQLAANLTCSDHDIARVLQFFDLEPSEMHHLLEELRQVSAMRESGSTAHQELIVEELLQGTWFTTSSRRRLTESLAGTRPGDGLADVLFSFVFKRVMDRVHRSLQDIFQWPTLTACPKVDIGVPPLQSLELPRFVEVVWADDLAFAVEDVKAETVVETIKIVTSHIFQQCLRHGMRPNMSKGKTEVMLRLQGAGSRQLRRDLYNIDIPTLTVDKVPDQYAQVQLTGAYRHLGHQLHAGDSIFAEIKARTGQASSVYRKYKRMVFQNPRLPLSKRKYLFKSLVLSILRFNLGAWPRLTDKQFHYFQTKVMAMYRGMVRATVAESTLRFWNHLRILEYLELPIASQI